MPPIRLPQTVVVFKGGGNTVDEDEVIGRCVAGDPEAFEGLVRAYQQVVYSLAFRMTGNPDDAMDVAQEAFLKAFRSLPAFRRGSPFRPWILRITANTANDMLRRRSHAARLSSGTQPTMDIPDPAPGPEEVAESTEENRRVKAALMALAPEYRTLVELFHVQGLSLAEVMQVTGLNLTVVKNRLFRARRMLRERLFREDSRTGTTPPAARAEGSSTGTGSEGEVAR